MDISKFDSVTIKKPDGTEERLPSSNFAALPITERVRLVSNGLAKFFKNGQQISAIDALRK